MIYSLDRIMAMSWFAMIEYFSQVAVLLGIALFFSAAIVGLIYILVGTFVVTIATINRRFKKK